MTPDVSIQGRMDQVKTRPGQGEVALRVARNVRQIRLRRGWSVARLAKECGDRGAEYLSQSSLYNIEREVIGLQEQKRRARLISIDELFVLAAAFNVSVDQLLGRVTCNACKGSPPQGFACLSCGAEVAAGAES